MRKSPIYKFKGEIDGKQQEILIDVTGSAPNFKVPSIQLEGTFDILLRGLTPSNTTIIDFGAAKLRNTLCLLEKSFKVYSCEFEDLFKRAKQASDFYARAKAYPNFRRFVFPHEFIELDEEFDVVLLINVLSIMPVTIERLCLLALLRDRMKEKERLLW